jgi:hypothetical protein
MKSFNVYFQQSIEGVEEEEYDEEGESVSFSTLICQQLVNFNFEFC